MKGPLILLIVSGAFVLLSAIVMAIFLLLPAMTDGRASGEEALWGVIPSASCCSLSFLGVIGGVIWLVVAMSKKNKNQP
ncbi:MAG: hypothetical protein HYS13_20820 [Planctomycetia bacterium]|nr:hypothetical protein [Planctomycetia bacterium]